MIRIFITAKSRIENRWNAISKRMNRRFICFQITFQFLPHTRELKQPSCFPTLSMLSLNHDTFFIIRFNNCCRHRPIFGWARIWSLGCKSVADLSKNNLKFRLSNVNAYGTN